MIIFNMFLVKNNFLVILTLFFIFKGITYIIRDVRVMFGFLERYRFKF